MTTSDTPDAAALLCDEKKTQREVAAVAQVTTVPIRNRYQEQLERLVDVTRHLMRLADEVPVGPGTPRATVAAPAVYAALKRHEAGESR